VPDPLAGANAKLQRAGKHLKTLDEQWRSFIETEPYAVSHEFKFQPPISEWSSHFVVERPIPVELSIIMGDILHNLRSCLDHLVGCFVERYGGAIKRHHAFPIYGDERKFRGRVEKARRKNDRGGPLNGIPSKSPEWALVKEAQPYHRGDARGEHPLAILNEMANIDKHRGLHAAMTYPEARSALDLLAWTPADAELIGYAASWRPGQPLENGTHIATLRFSAERPASQVRVKTPISLSVAFGDHHPKWPRGDFLEVASYVSEIVSRAEVLLR
jgi:hypothetical protein